MKLVVGLGNPGEKYQGTRHNLGFRVVEELGERVKGQGESWKYEEKFKAEILNFTLNASRFTLVKPQTYVNESGLAVSSIANFFKISAEDIIVIHDDLDLPIGKIKVRLGGSGAGHHGVESVIKELGTDQFIRVRLGIGNEKSHSSEHKRISFSAEKFVLEEFIRKEKSEVRQMIKQGIKVLEIIFDQGIESAQNQFNG
ncbi:aminoacyl-tRNA hydrolase [Candidatus Daviesbacteria bacterium]|nr:aminoacyl-tRNA hydrolase [Candidatus Daviesbacteria bacterium]